MTTSCVSAWNPAVDDAATLAFLVLPDIEGPDVAAFAVAADVAVPDVARTAPSSIIGRAAPSGEEPRKISFKYASSSRFCCCRYFDLGGGCFGFRFCVDGGDGCGC